MTGSDDNKSGGVWTLDATGVPKLLGDTYAYEKAANPDGKFKYGFQKTPKSCLAQLPKEFGPGSYSGVKETHSYAVATAAGVDYVADAGANAILALNAQGVFRTVAALKPVKVKVTPSAAQATHCRTAPSARSTPSRRCRPTSSTAPTASSTSPACRADRRTAAWASTDGCSRSTRPPGKSRRSRTGCSARPASRWPATATSTWPSCSGA